MGIFDFLKNKEVCIPNFLEVDMHSHLLPGIDDGSETLEDSVALIKKFQELGYKKLITTPHIMGDFYKNTPEIIFSRLKLLNDALIKEQIDISISAAAEYYLDEWFISNLEAGKEMLTFGDNYLLFETSFLNEPAQLKEAIFLIASNGYKPILAHPERYTYLYGDFKKYEELFDRGVYFQLNLNSLSGYYSIQAKKVAEKLIEKEMVHFVGTDCHGPRHLEALSSTYRTKSFQQLKNLNILNNSLL